MTESGGADLEAAMRKLDELPPELVRQEILKRPELLNGALDALVDLARNAEDSAVREDARRTIEDRGLQLLLLPDDGGQQRLPRHCRGITTTGVPR